MGRKLARTDAFKCSSYKLFYLLDQVVRHCIRSCAGTKHFAAVLILLQQEGHKFVHDEVLLLNLELNTLDRWILSFTQSLVLFVHQEMAGKCGNQSVLWFGARGSSFEMCFVLYVKEFKKVTISIKCFIQLS